MREEGSEIGGLYVEELTEGRKGEWGVKLGIIRVRRNGGGKEGE